MRVFLEKVSDYILEHILFVLAIGTFAGAVGGILGTGVASLLQCTQFNAISIQRGMLLGGFIGIVIGLLVWYGRRLEKKDKKTTKAPEDNEGIDRLK